MNHAAFLYRNPREDTHTHKHTHQPGHSCCVFTGAPHLRSPCVAKAGAAQCLLATMRNFPKKGPLIEE